MYRKNTTGQFVGFQMLLTASGAIATGLSPAVRRCIDGTFAAGGGTVTEDTGTGGYKYAMAQADTNGNDISLWFTATGAMPVCINFVTTVVDPTSANFGMTNVSSNAVQLAGQTITAAAGVTFPTSVASPTNITAASGVALATGQKVDVDTIKTNPVVNGGTITFPTSATLASTTNITAGTITTVSGNVTGSVGSVSGSVDSVTTGVTLAAGQKVDVDTIKTNPVVNAGTVTFPTTATLASTTNITAASGIALAAAQKVDVDTIKTNPVVNGGTITFPTNSTLASTTGAIGSVTGNVGGNVTGTIGGLAAQAITDVAAAVWNAVAATYNTALSMGAKLNSAGSAADPWTTPIPGAYIAGTAGHRLGNVPDIAAGSAGGIPRVGDAMTLTAGERTSIADAHLDRDMSTGADTGNDSTVRTVRQALRFLRNKWSIAGTTLTVTKEDDSTASWTAALATTPGADPITTVNPTGGA